LHRKRDWLGRVAHVFIERVPVAGRIEIERAARPEIERARRDLLWRPGVEAPPLICARLEHVRLRRGVIGVAFEEMAEERQLDLLSIELRRFRVETDIAQLVALFAS